MCDSDLWGPVDGLVNTGELMVLLWLIWWAEAPMGHGLVPSDARNGGILGF